MAKFVGKWKLESSSNFDDYMKTLGVGMVMRKLGGAAKPTSEISISGDTWSINTYTTFTSAVLNFKLGEMFDEATADGRKVKTTMTLENGTKLIQRQVAEIPSTVTRELVDEEGNTMRMTLVANDVTSTRIYKKAN
ncbi:Sodium/calcium exchanger regulatory protein 1 [Lamellibrachia satsuma]|nr:Sodium/calcium exchanger regulatory protein 1 [Lamellibrachia satsuma]